MGHERCSGSSRGSSAGVAGGSGAFALAGTGAEGKDALEWWEEACEAIERGTRWRREDGEGLVIQGGLSVC